LSAHSDRAAAAIAALVLLAAAVLLALPGPGLVPGAGAAPPRWVLGVFGDGLGISAGPYLALIYVAIAAWAALCLLARALPARAVWALIGAALAVFVLAPPLLSLDVFSYISYARLGVEEGLNPYESVPADLPADEAASRVDDFRFAVSVYGPLFTLVTYPLGAAGVAFALWALKALAGLSVLAIAALTAHLARLRGLPAAPAAAFVALNPLVLIHVVGGAHNDGLMVALAMVGIAAALTARPLAAGAALVGSAAMKAAGAVYAPFALAGSPQRLRLAAGLVATALVLGVVTLLAFGGSAAEALGVAGDNQATVSRWSVPGTLSRITGLDVDPIRIAFAALYAGAVVALLVWVVRGADWVRAAGWAALGLLVATAWMVPWYVIWVLPLAAIGRDRLLMLAAVALTVFQAINAVPV
jgi:alpha-1,6-mannosyltransferase